MNKTELQDDAPETASLTGAPAPPRPARTLATVLVVVLAALLTASLSLLALEVEHSRSAATAKRQARAAGNGGFVGCGNKDDPASYHKCVARLLALGEFKGPDTTTLYAKEVFQVDWSDVVTRADVLHMGALQRACTTHGDSVISWRFGRRDAGVNAAQALVNSTMDDQALLEVLSECPAFDVYIPESLRGQGYCEDAAAYTKYAHARMLPRWVFEATFFDAKLNRTVSYHELCPRTPVLMLNHYWDGLRDDKAWPKTKPLLLMPNIEMFELSADHLWQADAVLCKTVVCADYVSKWYQQRGNPRLSTVLFTRHTSSDVATSALVATGLEDETSDWSQHVRSKRKDFGAPRFIHTAGSSTQKGTAHVLDCWLARPDLPPVDVYLSQELYDRLFRKKYEALLNQNISNLRVHLGGLSDEIFGTMIANASFFLCPSRMEGYGHYINQARAAGGLIITPDVPPMNELVSVASGELIDAVRDSWARHFLGGSSKDALGLRNVSGFVSRFNGNDLCAAVDRVLTQTSEAQRVARAERARQQYLYDTAFFARKMRELRETLRPSGGDS